MALSCRIGSPALFHRRVAPPPEVVRVSNSPPRRGGEDAPSAAKAQTGWRGARARQGEASIEDRQKLLDRTSIELCPAGLALRASPPLRGEEWSLFTYN